MDYYDHYFNIKGKHFARYSENNISRLEMFDMMDDWNLYTPDYDISKNLSARHYNYYNEVVVYLDQYSHRGEDKIKLTLADAKRQYPNKLASLHYSTVFKQYKSTSYRLLQIGSMRYWLFYGSKNDWRSNNGDVEIKKVIEDKYYGYTKIPYPLYAIDFVEKINNRVLKEKEILSAIDFNTAPGLKGTPLEGELDSKEVVDSIKNFYKEYDKEEYLDEPVYIEEEEEIVTNFKYDIKNPAT